MLRIWILLALVGTAHAGYLEQTFAQQMMVDEKEVVRVGGFELQGHYNRALVGSYKHGEYAFNAIVLMRCDDAHCTAKPVFLGPGELEVLGAVDLAQSGALPTRRIELPRSNWFVPLGKRAAWPTLVVRTTQRTATTTKSYSMREVSGDDVRVEMSIVSLAKADAENPTVFREEIEARSPTGVGFRMTLEVDKHDLVATEHRSIDNELACIPPPPTTIRFTLEHRRFQRERNYGRSGC